MEKRFGVVSADGHCRLMHLPFDLWTKRLPRKFQDDGPRVVKGAGRRPAMGRRGTPMERGRLGRRRPWAGQLLYAGGPRGGAGARHFSRRQCAVSLRRHGPRRG